MPISIQDRTEHMLRRPPRPHPYANVRHDARGQYYDFKARLDLVETVLEDFIPHGANPGVQQFYELLRYINRLGAPFETTDCGLSQRLYRSTNSPFPDKAGWVGGRVMFMWRDLAKNCRQDTVRWVLDKILTPIQARRKQIQLYWLCRWPIPHDISRYWKRGYQIDVEFAMWGDSFEEAMQRFSDVVLVLDQSIKRCEAKL